MGVLFVVGDMMVGGDGGNWVRFLRDILGGLVTLEDIVC